MATNGGVSFRKIDSSKLSFFDLPGEVRELVYKGHFLSLGDFNIHLTNIAPDRPARTELPGPPSVPPCGLNRRAVFSTEYVHQLQSRKQRLEEHQAWKEEIITIEDLTTTLAQLDLDGYTFDDTFEDTIEDLISKSSQTNIMWTNLEAAAKVLQTEAYRYSYCQNLFKVVGPFMGKNDLFGIPYHSDLNVLPQQLLARIKNLELNDSMLGDPDKVTSESWTSGVWPTLLTKMVNLQNLWLSDVHPTTLCDDSQPLHHDQGLLRWATTNDSS